MIKKIQNESSLQQLFDNSKLYSEKLKSARNQEYFDVVYRSLRMSKYPAGFLVDIPITGEVVFECDRRIWQSLIFNNFVYDIQYEEQNEIKLDKIIRYIKFNQSFAVINEE